MKFRILLWGVFVVALAPRAYAIDWLHAPSKYTHDPQTGQRVAQFKPVEPVYMQARPDYLKSGFRYNRSTLRGANGSANYYHTVEEWGRPVRPYGEWKYPYRPYSVPYSAWGPPYGGLGGSYGYGYATPYGGNGGNGGQPGIGFGFGGGYGNIGAGNIGGGFGGVSGNIGGGNIGGGNHGGGNIGHGNRGVGAHRGNAHDDFWIRNPRTNENLNPRLLPHHRHPRPAPRIDAGAAVGGT